MKEIEEEKDNILIDVERHEEKAQKKEALIK